LDNFRKKNADILFVDTKNNKSSVFANLTGFKNHFFISDSLLDFLQAITLCINLENELFPNDSWFDNEDCSVKPIVWETYLLKIKDNDISINLESFYNFFFG